MISLEQLEHIERGLQRPDTSSAVLRYYVRTLLDYCREHERLQRNIMLCSAEKALGPASRN